MKVRKKRRVRKKKQIKKGKCKKRNHQIKLKQMKILNKTKKTIVSKDAERCESILCKTIGLIGTSKKQKKTLLFVFNNERIIDLHMFFVFYKIDVVFLDKNKKVVEIKKSFRPFTVYISKKKAMYVVEGGEGMVKKTKVGDLFGFR